MPTRHRRPCAPSRLNVCDTRPAPHIGQTRGSASCPPCDPWSRRSRGSLRAADIRASGMKARSTRSTPPRRASRGGGHQQAQRRQRIRCSRRCRCSSSASRQLRRQLRDCKDQQIRCRTRVEHEEVQQREVVGPIRARDARVRASRAPSILQVGRAARRPRGRSPRSPAFGNVGIVLSR